MLSDGTRLLTLSGPGGSGKTRLAVEVAAELVPAFKAGVFWVGLSALRDPSLVIPTIAQTLGAKDDLPAYVSERDLLLLLDNFEQVVEAAPNLSQLLEACPNLRLLVTSRELLRIRGEVEYPVAALAELEAVELFCDRARLEPDETIAELCRHLDDMPLALELAAARASVLTPAQILDRLAQRLDLLKGGRDADPRQQTLRATIEWSYDLLEEAEQELFARITVFAGGCTVDAAEQISDADLDVLQSLVDKSLLRHNADRFWMLETIREFAAELLEAVGEGSELRDRHSAWYISLGERAAPELHARQGPGWLDRLDAEQANLRASLDHLLGREDKEGALRLCGAIWLYWATRGHWTEGRRFLNSGLTLGGEVDPELQVEALWGAAVLAIWQDDADEGECLATRLLDIAREAELQRGEAIGVHTLAMAARQRGELERAHELFEKSRPLAREVGDMWLLSAATFNLGTLYMAEGDFERAIELFEESLAIGEARGDLDRRARALSWLAYATYELGEFARAYDLYRRALLAAEEIGTATEEFNTVWGIASYQARLGDAVVAARLLGWWTEERLRLRPGAPSDPDAVELEESLREKLGQKRATAEIANGATMTRKEAIDLALGRGDSAKEKP